MIVVEANQDMPFPAGNRPSGRSFSDTRFA
jgi:hypothetical protein